MPLILTNPGHDPEQEILAVGRTPLILCNTNTDDNVTFKPYD